jgi:hypothetical protein
VGCHCRVLSLSRRPRIDGASIRSKNMCPSAGALTVRRGVDGMRSGHRSGAISAAVHSARPLHGEKPGGGLRVSPTGARVARGHMPGRPAGGCCGQPWSVDIRWSTNARLDWSRCPPAVNSRHDALESRSQGLAAGRAGCAGRMRRVWRVVELARWRRTQRFGSLRPGRPGRAGDVQSGAVTGCIRRPTSYGRDVTGQRASDPTPRGTRDDGGRATDGHSRRCGPVDANA